MKIYYHSFFFVYSCNVASICLFEVLTFFSYLDCCSGVSSFNEFIHDLSIDSDDSSSLDYSSGEDDLDEDACHSPASQSSRVSRASSLSRHNRHKRTWMALIISWILFPIKLLLATLSYLFFSPFFRKERSSSSSKMQNSPRVNSLKKVQTLRDHFIQRATDRRRGVIEVLSTAI